MCIDVFTNGENENPITCPKCGARTEWVELEREPRSQEHDCLNKQCLYKFIMEYDKEPI